MNKFGSSVTPEYNEETRGKSIKKVKGARRKEKRKARAGFSCPYLR
jgi:ribosomal protein L21